MATAHIVLSYSTTSNENTSAVIKVTMKYYGNGVSHSGYKETCKVTLNGVTKTFSSSFTASTSAQTLGSASFTIDKTHSSQTLTASGSFDAGAHTSLGTLKDTVSVSVSAKTSYVVSYDANGGSGAPSDDKKWYGETLTLSSTKPSRTGYKFEGWGTSATTSTVSYSPGDTYKVNAKLNLYAVWTKQEYTLTFNANGGTVSPKSKKVSSGSTYGTLPTPVYTGYDFLGWFTSKSGGNQVSSSTKMGTADVTVYAHWKVSEYTITFYRNWPGDDTPQQCGTLTKKYNVDIKLTCTPPAPSSSFTLYGWSSSRTGARLYSVNDTRKANGDINLYAMWTREVYTAYYGNASSPSATNIPSTQHGTYLYPHESGWKCKISSLVPLRTGYNFVKWAIDSPSSSTYCSPGETITVGSGASLYAQWSPRKTLPKISSFRAERCLSNGVADDEGTYLSVSASWIKGRYLDAAVTTTAVITCTQTGSSTSTEIFRSSDVTSVSMVDTQVILSLDYSYQVQLSVIMTYGPYNATETVTSSILIPNAFYTIDVDPTGKHLGIFGAATSGISGAKYVHIKDGYMYITTTGNTEARYRATSANASVDLLASASSSNHGIYSYTNSRWIVRDDGTNAWLGSSNGLSVNNSTGKITSRGVYSELYEVTEATCSYTSLGANASLPMTDYPMTAVSGYDAVGIVGYWCDSAYVQPYAYYVKSNSVVRVGIINHSSDVVNGAIRFKVLWLKATKLGS